MRFVELQRFSCPLMHWESSPKEIVFVNPVHVAIIAPSDCAGNVWSHITLVGPKNHDFYTPLAPSELIPLLSRQPPELRSFAHPSDPGFSW